MLLMLTQPLIQTIPVDPLRVAAPLPFFQRAAPLVRAAELRLFADVHAFAGAV